MGDTFTIKDEFNSTIWYYCNSNSNFTITILMVMSKFTMSVNFPMVDFMSTILGARLAEAWSAINLYVAEPVRMVIH